MGDFWIYVHSCSRLDISIYGMVWGAYIRGYWETFEAMKVIMVIYIERLISNPLVRDEKSYTAINQRRIYSTWGQLSLLPFIPLFTSSSCSIDLDSVIIFSSKNQ